MPTIRPFRALLFSPKLRSQMNTLIAPPYDVISPQGLTDLRNRSEYNAVKLSLVDDAKDPTAYKRMGERFRDWKAKGILEKDSEQGFYLIEEKFSVAGKNQMRVGFVALMETSKFEEKKVLPHEFTLAGPKKDRLELLKEMGAELSQVFLCYQDSDLILEGIYKTLSSTTPLFDIPETDHVARRVWKISRPADCEKLQGLISKLPTLIADGHHRYETSLHFREIDGTDKSKYVQVYLTNLESPGFAIQPIHRLFSLPDSLSIQGFLESLRKDFDLKKVNQIDPKILENLHTSNQIGFFVSVKDTNEIFLASRMKTNEEDAEIFAIQNEILERRLGWDTTKTSYGVLKYEHELGDFQRTLQELDRGIGIFLPSTNLNLVMERAKRGERMPQKSTFFYPKIASGLINYELGSV